jgi:hypothetical protein
VRARLLIVPAVFAAAAAAHTQPPPPPPLYPDVRSQVIPPAPAVPAPVVTAEKSLEKMLDQLEGLRTRKADLEKQEQELMKEVRKLLEKQDERVKRLGVVPPAPPLASAPPPVVPAGPPPPGLIVPVGLPELPAVPAGKR